jgi:hypothetical protein
MKKYLLIPSAALLLIWAMAMTGCSDSTEPQTDGVGSIRVSLIDAPGDFDEVNVEVIRVEVHRGDDGDDESDDGSGWHTIDVDTTHVDLLTLTDGNSAVLADSTLPSGYYTQIRLILGDGNNLVIDGVAHDLEVPSSANTGLKLNHPFTIDAGAMYEVTLDFDADRSVHMTGNGQYKMKPVIRAIVTQTSGSLEGVVEPIEARAFVWTTAGDDTVTAYADTLSGQFRFVMLPAGDYDLNFEATAGSYRDSVIFDIPVIAGQNTDFGTVTLEAE